MTVDRTHRIDALGNWPINYGEELTTLLGVKLAASCSVNLRTQFWWFNIAGGKLSCRSQPQIQWGASFATVFIGIVRSQISKQVMDGYCHKRNVSRSPANPKTVAAAIDFDQKEMLGQMPYFLYQDGSVVSVPMPSPSIGQAWQQQEGDR